MKTVLKITYVISFLQLLFTVSIAQATRTDSVVVPASTYYSNASFWRLWFIGKNYRREWSQPVKLPVFYLNKEQGGMMIVDSGGGRQTNTLRLIDKSGREWNLRSADKDVTKTLTPLMQNTMAETLIQDFNSAIHPYAALTVPELAKAIGVTVAKPRIFFIPDDPSFGVHRALFANKVCFLEEREPTPEHIETKSSSNVLEKISNDTEYGIVQKQILRARLLDMLLGDWDRHEDQWRWAEKDSLRRTYYYPIPRDRDFVYFKSDGIFMKFAAAFFQPYLIGFSKEPRRLRRLNAKVIDLDMLWLNQLSAADWEKEISLIETRITDNVIANAIKKMPPEVYAISGKNITSRLKTRRNSLRKHAMKYYAFLASNPVVNGTDENEFFSVQMSGSGVAVTVKGSQESKRILYNRVFTADETKIISLRGFAGNDQFVISQNVSSSIRVLVEGGDGNDEYKIQGKVRAKVLNH